MIIIQWVRFNSFKDSLISKRIPPMGLLTENTLIILSHTLIASMVLTSSTVTMQR